MKRETKNLNEKRREKEVLRVPEKRQQTFFVKGWNLRRKKGYDTKTLESSERTDVKKKEKKKTASSSCET